MLLVKMNISISSAFSSLTLEQSVTARAWYCRPCQPKSPDKTDLQQAKVALPEDVCVKDIFDVCNNKKILLGYDILCPSFLPAA
jgi:hypothetical protein